MRKIKVVRDKTASQTKSAIDIGDVAPVVLENFETLTNPKFKPKLELIEGDPHDPPTMNTNTDQNIKTDGEDSKRPSTEEIARGGSDYENAEAPKAEDIPHEHEHVKQGAKTADEDSKPDFLKSDEEKKEEEESEGESDDNNIEAKIREAKADYHNRYQLASQLFDIRKQAGVEDEASRYSYVNLKAESTDTNTLEAQINDARSYLGQIVASQPAQEKKVAGITLPGGFTGATPRQDSPFEDDTELIIMGG